MTVFKTYGYQVCMCFILFNKLCELAWCCCHCFKFVAMFCVPRIRHFPAFLWQPPFAAFKEPVKKKYRFTGWRDIGVVALFRFVYKMFCVKTTRSLRTKENCFASTVKCWGKISRLSKTDSEKYGFLKSVCFCVKHLQEEKQKKSMCCFPKRSEEDKCSGRLSSCPQRLLSVFESIGSARIGSGKLCESHLKQADSDERITGNKSYVSPRKVSLIKFVKNVLEIPSKFCFSLARAIRLRKFFVLFLLYISDNTPVAKMKQNILRRLPQEIHQTGKNYWRSSMHWKRKTKNWKKIIHTLIARSKVCFQHWFWLAFFFKRAFQQSGFT